jgi:hypothetical protein
MKRIKDDTVPYPSAAIETTDHFTEWAEIGIEVESDADGIMRSWRKNGEVKVERKKGWARKLGTLPPVLRYRYPFNYVSLHCFDREVMGLMIRSSCY